MNTPEYEALEPIVESIYMSLGDLEDLAEALEQHARGVRESMEMTDDED